MHMAATSLIRTHMQSHGLKARKPVRPTAAAASKIFFFANLNAFC